MSRFFMKMAMENDFHPIRMGQPWSEDEDKRLLESIHKKRSIETIASEHQRTKGGIDSRRKFLATEYHYNDNLPIETICMYTGLSKIQVEMAINKREEFERLRQMKKPPTRTDNTELIELLRNIDKKLNLLLDIKMSKTKVD